MQLARGFRVAIIAGIAATAGACSGDDDEPAATAQQPELGTFCDDVIAVLDMTIAEVGLDPSSESYQDAVDQLRAVDAPDEIDGDWGTLADLYAAPPAEPLDPASTEGEAVARVETFLRDECDIDLNAPAPPPDS